MPKEIKFAVGDVIRLNPKNKSYSRWVSSHTAGPFLVLKTVGDVGERGRTLGKIRRLADGKEFESGEVTTWLAVRDEFLDAAYKANHDTQR